MGVKNLLSLLNTVTETEKKVDPIDQFKKYKNKASYNAKAQFNLACCYYNGLGCEKNVNEAIKYFQLSSNNGNIHAHFTISQMYYNGIHFEKNLNEAFKYCKLAADNHLVNDGEYHINAIFNLASYYYNGEGCISNLKESTKYFLYLLNDTEAQEIINKIQIKNRTNSIDSEVTVESNDADDQFEPMLPEHIGGGLLSQASSCGSDPCDHIDEKYSNIPIKIKSRNDNFKIDLIVDKPYQYIYRTFSYFSGKKVAIDASLLIYQYVIGIRNTSHDLVSLDGDFTSHIHAVVSKSLLYLDNNITPIFVFDGKPPEIKSDTLIKRRIDRLTAKTQMDNELNESEKIKLFKKSTIITYKQMDQCKEILRAMGIPVVESLQEADSQLAYLTKEHDVYGAGSEDADLLAFETTKFLKNISSSKKNNIIEYDLNNTLKNFGLNMYEFIDLCILLGCDYVEAIPGITPNDAYNIIKKHRSIVNFLKSDDSIKYKFPENYRKDCIAASSYFLECPHKPVTSDQLKLGIYDINKIKDLLIKKYSYSRTKVDKIISKISNESFEKKPKDHPITTHMFYKKFIDPFPEKYINPFPEYKKTYINGNKKNDGVDSSYKSHMNIEKKRFYSNL